MQKPQNIGIRGSIWRTHRPASGPVMNMARPETSMVVPTSAAENCRIRPRYSGIRNVPP